MKQLYQQYPQLEAELDRQGRKKAWLGRHLRNRAGKPMTANDISNRLSGYHNMTFNEDDKQTIAMVLGRTKEELF